MTTMTLAEVKKMKKIVFSSIPHFVNVESSPLFFKPNKKEFQKDFIFKNNGSSIDMGMKITEINSGKVVSPEQYYDTISYEEALEKINKHFMEKDESDKFWDRVNRTGGAGFKKVVSLNGHKVMKPKSKNVLKLNVEGMF